MQTTIVEARRYSGEVERHQHAYHQLILPRSGCLEIEMEQRSGRVTGGIGSFVTAGCVHSFSARPRDAFIVLDVPAGIGAEALEREVVPPFFAITPDVRGLLDYMIAIGDPEAISASLRAAWSTLVLDRLARHVDSADRVELAVRRATAFMKRKFAQPVRVADIAEAAGLSSTVLHDAFQRRRSSTPHAQLVTIRLDAAERLLADPSLSIAEIAIRTGHADQSTLTRAMRRERGTTPALLRRSLLARSEG